MLYLIIEFERTSAWNLVMPVIEIPAVGQIYYFDGSSYAFQGKGGGNNQLEAVIEGVKLLRDTGKVVNLIAGVAKNEYIKRFEKNMTTWEDLKQSAVECITTQFQSQASSAFQR
jgi:hypothetical protein